MIVINFALCLALCFVLCFVVHEGGHYGAALCFGRRIKFRFAWGRYCVPRYVWDMPQMERSKQRVVAAAGFAAEAIVAGILAALSWPWMAGAVLLHFVAYPLYAGEASDFKWFK